MKKHVLNQFLCMVLGGLIFGSVAYASNINVQFLPLKYFINGEQISPLRGQEGFIHNGRVYVPLRFLSESLGCAVDWDKETSTIGLTITPDDIPTPTTETDKEQIYLTGTWQTQSGSIFNLKQDGTILNGTFTHYADEGKLNKSKSERIKHEFPVTGQVNGKTVELTVTYDDAEVYENIKKVPLKVARQVVGIAETYTLELDSKSNTLEGEYFRNYVEWDDNTLNVTKKFDGNSETAKEKVPPIQLKIYFKNPI